MTVLGAVLRMTGIHGTDDTWETIVECMLAFATGAFTGRAFTGYWRPALALGSATLALMLTMGGPIPVTNSAHATMLLAAFAGIYPLCGLVLAAIGSVLSRVSGPAA
jgi:hypothetical protein